MQTKEINFALSKCTNISNFFQLFFQKLASHLYEKSKPTRVFKATCFDILKKYIYINQLSKSIRKSNKFQKIFNLQNETFNFFLFSLLAMISKSEVGKSGAKKEELFVVRR